MPLTSVPITPGVGRAVATDLIGGLDYQTIKPAFGAVGTATLVTGNSPLPVGLAPHAVTPYTEIAVNCAANGDNDIIAAVGGITLRIYGFFLVFNDAVNVKWKDGAGIDLHPALHFIGDGSAWMLPRDGAPWFTLTISNKLVLNLSAAVQVSGRLYYTAT
jgi:hypothetical protein